MADSHYSSAENRPSGESVLSAGGYITDSEPAARSRVKKRVLILCTGNSARSQMAEGLLRHDAGNVFEVESAGTRPGTVRPEAIKVMQELGIDISGHRSKHLDEFKGQQFDYIITVCQNAIESCPVFLGAVKRLHESFEDPPPPSVGTDEVRMSAFRRVRDQLRSYLKSFAANPDSGQC